MADDNSDSSITGRLSEGLVAPTPRPQLGGVGVSGPSTPSGGGSNPSVAPTPQPASNAVSVELGSLAGPVANTAPSALRPDYLPPNTQLRGWTVVEKLGAGGMGAVYLVRNDQVDPPEFAALKLSLPPASDESKEDRAARIRRFEREFGAVFQLEHPHIVKPFEFFTWPTRAGHPCIVMPYVQGATLTAHMRREQPSLRVVVSQLLCPIADALDYIHSKGIFHRDVKPANIMVRDGGVPLLMDFGIARSRASSTLTSTEVLTTYEYGAPEYLGYIASPERSAEQVFDYQAGADIFCLGATFFDLLTGHLPYQHVPGVLEPLGYMSPTFQRSLASYEPLSARSLNADVPAEVDELLARMMARDPGQRFATGGELLDAAEALLRDIPVSADEWDRPFMPPPRVRPSKQLAEAPSRRSRPPPPPPPSATRAEGSAQPAPRSLVAPSLVAASLSAPSLQRSVASQPGFQPPTAAPAPVFQSVAARPPAPRVEVAEAELPSQLLAAKQRLQATGESGNRQRYVSGALAVLVVLLVVGLVASFGAPPPQAPQSTSLLDEKDATASPRPAPAPVNPAILDPAAQPAPLADAEPQPNAVVVPSPLATRSSVKRGANPDAKAIDGLLASEYGGQRPTLGGTSPTAAPAVVKKKSWVQGMDDDDETPAVAGKTTLGIPTGTEIPARIVKPLDSRTTNAGPAVAKLARPFALRGKLLLPTGTMLYGTAGASSAGRFDVRFTRMKLPDGQELEFDAIAYDAGDKKPGLQPTTRTQNSGGNKSPALGTQIAKNTASAALGQLPGDVVVDMAKGAGQTILNHEGSGPAPAQELLTLEAPADFTLFIREPF